VSSDVEAERLIEKIKASPDMAAAGPSNEYTNDAFIYDV
jgi:hypothetical protein